MSDDGFRSWLKKQGYRPGSVRKAVADIGLLRSAPGFVPASAERVRDLRRAAALWERCKGRALDAPVPPLPPKATTLGPRQHLRRQKPAVSFDGRAYDALRAAIKLSPLPAARVLEVMFDTGLRVGDVLRVRYEALLDARRRLDGLLVLEVKGGEPVIHSITSSPAWGRLGAAMQAARALNVAALVSPGHDNPEADGPAYKATSRALKRFAEALGPEVAGRVHLHRIRRTIAVRMLAQGESVALVGKALNHRGGARTTNRYIDEGMALQAAEALRRLTSPSPGTTPSAPHVNKTRTP